MRAEIIAIGDELTSGQRLDTNSQWLAAELAKLGVRTAFHSTVGDSLAENIDVFRSAANRSDLIISTGGLGPTADDLTRDAIADAFQRPLEFSQIAMTHIEQLFAHRKRPMPERNRVQAMFPQGSRLIDNRFGSAPGIDLDVAGVSSPSGATRIFALPGVPAEMHEMFSEVVRPRLIDEMGVGKEQWYFKNLRLFGLGESDVEVRIPDLIARQREPLVGITVSRATINLRIATLAASQEEADAEMQSTLQEVRSSLGEFIFGEDDDELWDVVLRRLLERSETLSILEYGASNIAGPFFAAAQNSLAPAQPIVLNSHWQYVAPDANETERHAASADWLLVFGPVPKVVASEKPAGEVLVSVYHHSNLARQESVPFSGHPDIVLSRLAKQATKILFELVS